MAPSCMHQPIVQKKAQPLLMTSGCRDADAPDTDRPTGRHASPDIKQPAARHWQFIGALAERPHHDRAGAPPDAGEPCLPPECWIG